MFRTLGETVIPSSKTAFAVANGDTSALPLIARDLFGRSLLIGTGIALAGADLKTTLKYGLAGSAAIECFVLGYAVFQTKIAK